MAVVYFGGAPTSRISPRLRLSSLVAGLDEGRKEVFHSLAELGRELGFSIYLVGGSVRDALIGTQVLDLDFSVVGDGVAIGKRFAEQSEGKLTVYQQFGTATVVTPGCRVDLVTARREEYPTAGQLPQVTPGSIDDDLKRRDFTINAMAVRVWPEGGDFLDPLGGFNDLEAGVIRVLHGRSFVDDPTRMFRAVRYEQRLGFRIDDETQSLLSDAVSRGLMDSVSGDRWLHEVERILDEAEPGLVLLRAAELGLMSGLHPSLAKDGDIRALVDCGEVPQDPDEWLAGLFSPLTSAEGEELIQRLRLSGPRATLARDTIDLRNIEETAGELAERPSELYRILRPFAPQAIAARMKLTGDLSVRRALSRYLNELRFVRSSLTGDDLLEMGVPQGPLVGEILTQLRDARMDGRLLSREDERALARCLLAHSQEGATK